MLLDKIKQFLASSSLEKGEFMEELYWELKTRLLYRRCFGHLGEGSRILQPMRLTNVENIYVGNGVRINKQAFLLTVQIPGKHDPRLTLHDGCIIGHMNHITCVDEVTLGYRVLTADRVHISDNSHTFADPDIPIRDQGVTSKGRVSIGDGSWIGENASLLSCNVGRHCIIGSNAVVLDDIPDYSIAVGIPARVVRRFEPASRKWERI